MREMTTTVHLHRRLEVAAERFGERPAILAGDGRWSFRDLDRASNACARHLASVWVGRGDRVAVMMSNRPEFLVTIGDYTPPGVQSLLDAWMGIAPQPLPMVILAAITVVSAITAARLFRWE